MGPHRISTNDGDDCNDDANADGATMVLVWLRLVVPQSLPLIAKMPTQSLPLRRHLQK